jgi:hypothetical protein
VADTKGLLQDPLLREIEEDLRRERYSRLWQRYGKYAVAAVVLLFAAVIAVQLWQRHQRQRAEAASGQFIAAMMQRETNRDAATALFSALGRDGPAGYAMLARFQHAALLAEAGDAEAAIAIYRTIESSAAAPAYRQLASLQAVMLAIDHPAAGLSGDEVDTRLAALAAADSPFRFSARELQAVIALNGGRRTEAAALLSELKSDPATPPGVRERAAIILSQSAAQ